MSLFADAMGWVHDNQRPAASLISFTGTALLAVTRWILTARTKIEWSKVSEVSFLASEVETTHVERFSVYNSGRKAAEDVEVSINSKPIHINVNPNVRWSMDQNPDNSIVIKIPVLNGQERFYISLLSQGLISPTISHLRYKGGPGVAVKTVLYNAESWWMAWTKRIIIFIGVAAVLTLIVSYALPYIPKTSI